MAENELELEPETNEDGGASEDEENKPKPKLSPEQILGIKKRQFEQDKKEREDKANFEMGMKAKEMNDQRIVEDGVEAESLAPNLIESMKSIVQDFAQVIEKQQKFQEAIVSQMNNPKTISAKSSSGATMSATVQ